MVCSVGLVLAIWWNKSLQMVFMEIHDPGVVRRLVLKHSHEGRPGGTSTFLGAQWVLVYDSVNGKNENRPCDVSKSPFAQNEPQTGHSRHDASR